MPPRVAYFGTPRFSVPALTALIAGNHQVVGVVTQPDRPRGRGQHVVVLAGEDGRRRASNSDASANTLRDTAFDDAFRAWQPDIAVVAAYGQLCRKRCWIFLG